MFHNSCKYRRAIKEAECVKLGSRHFLRDLKGTGPHIIYPLWKEGFHTFVVKFYCFILTFGRCCVISQRSCSPDKLLQMNWICSRPSIYCSHFQIIHTTLHNTAYYPCSPGKVLNSCSTDFSMFDCWCLAWYVVLQISYLCGNNLCISCTYMYS